MHTEINEYVQKCETCKLTKVSNENTQALAGEYRDPGRVGRMLSVDFIGQLPASKIHKHQVEVVALDCFSKYAFTRSFVQATASNLIDFMEKEIFFKFGVPEVVICDNGTQFESKVFNDFLAKYRIRKLSTPLYYAQANPVEATNKTLKTMIRSEILERAAQHEDWAAYLPYVTMNFNTMPHSVTKYSPHFIVFGHEKVRSGDEYRVIIDANPDADTAHENKDFRYDETAERNRAAFEQGKQRYNMRSNTRTFNVNDEVMIRKRKLSNAGDKYTKKLGPTKFAARIKNKIGSDTYEVVHRTTGEVLGIFNARDIFTR